MIEVILGDISALSFSVDAIVNAANQALIPGGGVDGALNRAAGSELAKAMRSIGGTPIGTAVITPAFQLPAKYVIHAVGPRYRDGAHGESEQLRHAYAAVFALCREYGIRSVALPVLSAGIYGYPKKEAAEILYEEAKKEENQQIESKIIVFDSSWLSIFSSIDPAIVNEKERKEDT